MNDNLVISYYNMPKRFPEQFWTVSSLLSTDQTLIARSGSIFSTTMATMWGYSTAFVTVWTTGSWAMYECDWIADQVQIQSAIDQANTAGGWDINILDWSYTTSEAIELKTNVNIFMWNKTVITGTVTDPLFYNNATALAPTTNFSLSWWQLNHGGTAAWANQTIRVQYGSDFTYNNVSIVNAGLHAFWIVDCDNFIVQNCFADEVGIANSGDWVWVVIEDCNTFKVVNNTTNRTGYHWIQTRGSCSKVVISGNITKDCWNVNTAWAWINLQTVWDDISVYGNIINDSPVNWISLENVWSTTSVWGINIFWNTVTGTQNNAAILVNTSSNINIYGNTFNGMAIWVKVSWSDCITISNNTGKNITSHGVYIITASTIINVTGNTFSWMAWGTTVWVFCETAWTSGINITWNLFSGSRYLARFAAWVDNVNMTGNMGKVTNLSSAIRNDSWWSNMTVATTTNITYL